VLEIKLETGDKLEVQHSIAASHHEPGSSWEIYNMVANILNASYGTSMHCERAKAQEKQECFTGGKTLQNATGVADFLFIPYWYQRKSSYKQGKSLVQ